MGWKPTITSKTLQKKIPQDVFTTFDNPEYDELVLNEPNALALSSVENGTLVSCAVALLARPALLFLHKILPNDVAFMTHKMSIAIVPCGNLRVFGPIAIDTTNSKLVVPLVDGYCIQVMELNVSEEQIATALKGTLTGKKLQVVIPPFLAALFRQQDPEKKPEKLLYHYNCEDVKGKNKINPASVEDQKQFKEIISKFV